MQKVKAHINKGKTIKELIYNAAKDFPDNNAFRYKVNGVITSETYSQLIHDMECLGTSYRKRGFQGKRIGIIGENCFPWYLCYLAAVCGGNTAVPFDKGLTAVELETCVNRSEVKIVFYDSKISALVDEIKAKVSDEIQFLPMTGEQSVVPSMIEEGEKLMSEGDLSYRDVVVKEEDIAVFLFTSGTTNDSKIVMLSHDNLASNVRDMHEMEMFFPNDVNMAFLPLHHSFGLGGVMVFLAAGADNVFCDGLKYVQKNFTEYGVSVFVGVPLIVENLYNKVMKQIEKQGKMKTVNTGLKISNGLRKIGIDVRRKIFAEIIDKLGGSLRLIICGAAALDPAVAKGLNDFGISTIQGYGLTETSPVLCAERPDNLCAGSVGTPMPSVEIRIVDKDENGIGEIIAKAPNVMVGYYMQPEETAEAIQDGWFHTGDLGRIDNKGNLWITGRLKNVIVLKNGKNVFPEEIEELIAKIPYVAECMMFTREKHNELVLWVKITYDKAAADADGLSKEQVAEIIADGLNGVNEIMPKFKNVNHFILTDEPMIKTTTQKIKRRMEMVKIDADWDEAKGYVAAAKK